ncbi:hypothetical protein F8O06_07020 [Pseudoclavibacter sp. CFCC 14310]|uniref:hypothetical protein n=1 Tax=Pseudoclavibacter sp. CFCC 14310 TaxID=2615180 RepID=UPI001300EDBB|nr:hypothetical protein [Pseudoclavibacter sp. CFCC 14310]KAB1646479.1 hypothetical protein F8O06_07020 [Pseudoclavibacter sp. CFCC 14310]
MADQPEGLRAALESEDLLEELAAIEHERWSHWQRYLHDQCVDGPDGSLIIPADQARRWSNQMNTPYGQLSDDERESDREQVRRYLPIIARTLDEATVDCDQQPDTAE